MQRFNSWVLLVLISGGFLAGIRGSRADGELGRVRAGCETTDADEQSGRGGQPHSDGCHGNLPHSPSLVFATSVIGWPSAPRPSRSGECRCLP